MYQERRTRLLESLPDYSLTLLYSKVAPYSIGDEKYPFKVDRSFYYFTGIDYEGLYLLLVKMGRITREILFIEPFDETMAKWVGGKIRENEAKQTSGINDIRYVNDLESTFNTYLNNYGKIYDFTLCGDLTKQELSQYNKVSDLFTTIRNQYPCVTIKNIYENIAMLRMVKDDSEIALMEKAIEITKEGIENMMNFSHQNVWENELEAYFDYILKCNQADHAFASIIATGKNATILHYSKNNQYAKDNELVLCDLGAAYKKYNADITRTFPVNGRFTERQKQIYDIVLRANKMVANIAKPGLSTIDLNNRVIDFYQVELEKIGLLTGGKTVRDYYWHGVSHPIGLETHDISLPAMPLKAGCVISNEPGLYLEEEGIGIRIEDDLLITEDGCKVLSKDIIKEIEDIENFMGQK